MMRPVWAFTYIGLAGDSYTQKKSKASLVASDIIEHLGNTKLLD